MISWGPNLVFVCFFNQGSKHLRLSHDCNSQSESASKNHWDPSFTFTPICESAFHTWTHFLALMGLCTLHFTLSCELYVRVMTKGKKLHHFKQNVETSWMDIKKFTSLVSFLFTFFILLKLSYRFLQI
jgi:hypothetical protein